MICQGCGRETGRLIRIGISFDGTLAHDYHVCVNCYNSFIVVTNDTWAFEIASCREMRDPPGKSYPPLICGGSYAQCYSEKPFSYFLQEKIKVLQSNLEGRLLTEAEERTQK